MFGVLVKPLEGRRYAYDEREPPWQLLVQQLLVVTELGPPGCASDANVLDLERVLAKMLEPEGSGYEPPKQVIQSLPFALEGQACSSGFERN